MELMEGGTLVNLMRDIPHTLFSENAMLVLLTDCIRALAHLHQELHLAHFDIKPSNILLDSARRRAKLADFGLALNPELITVDYPRGTYRYMPPELYSENPADYRVDIWSLGISFYEVSVGKHPFHLDDANLSDEETKMQTRMMVLADPVPPLTSRFFQISSDFSNLIEHMMEKNQQARPLVQELLASKLVQNVLMKGTANIYFKL